MVNELIRAIAKAIKNEFPQCDIFTEELEQGFESPCFFIFCEGQREYDKLDVRFLAEHTFVIEYFPKERNQNCCCCAKGDNGDCCCCAKGDNGDCWEVQSKLNRLLELIALDDGSLVRGTNRKGEIHDNVLHFFVDYDFYMLKRKQPDEYMEVLNVYEKTRNGRK